ncbi:MAG: DUF1573 domain-containing protein [Patescibacteria group bacterium]
MKNKTLIILVLIVLGIIALFLWKGDNGTAVLPAESQIDSGSILTAEKNSYDFGTISMKDGSVTTTFVVSNKTENDLRVDTVVTSCMCTNAYIVDAQGKRGPFGMPGHGNEVPRANEIIKAGEEKTIEVVFDPAAHGPLGVGPIERQIYLVDEKGGALQLEIKAMVTL